MAARHIELWSRKNCVSVTADQFANSISFIEQRNALPFVDLLGKATDSLDIGNALGNHAILVVLLTGFVSIQILLDVFYQWSAREKYSSFKILP